MMKLSELRRLSIWHWGLNTKRGKNKPVKGKAAKASLWLSEKACFIVGGWDDKYFRHVMYIYILVSRVHHRCFSSLVFSADRLEIVKECL
jgi:hypothetical protein